MAKDVFTIELKKSVYLLRYLLITHSIFFVSSLFIPIDWPWRIILCLVVLLSFSFYYHTHYHHCGRIKVNKIRRLVDKTWTLYYGDGHEVEGLELDHCIVIPQLVILYFRAQYFWQRRSVYVTAEQSNAELLRQLRVYCRDPKIFQK